MGTPLSPREKQIVRLVCVAKLNKEIAYELCLSEGTVKVYLSVIFKKLRIQNRTQLAIWAAAHEQARTLASDVVQSGEYPHLSEPRRPG